MATRVLTMNSSLPVGYRFHPTDEEFVDHYLKLKVLGSSHEVGIIPEEDICMWEPDQLPRRFKEKSGIQCDDQEWWFFCPRSSGQRVQRSTRGGFWKITCGDKDVMAKGSSNRVIGVKKTLTFYKGRNCRGNKTNWVIHEYHLLLNDLDVFFPGNLRRDFVLCRLKNKRDKKTNSAGIEAESYGSVPMNFQVPVPQPEPRIQPFQIQGMIDPLMIRSSRREDLFDLSNSSLQPVQSSVQARHNLTGCDFQSFFNANGSSSHGGFIVSPSSMDIPFGNNGLTVSEDCIPSDYLYGASEEEEENFDFLGTVISEPDENSRVFGNSEPGRTNHAVLMENRREKRFESLHGVVEVEAKEGVVESKFNDLRDPPKPTSLATDVQLRLKKVENHGEASQRKNASEYKSSPGPSAAKAKVEVKLPNNSTNLLPTEKKGPKPDKMHASPNPPITQRNGLCLCKQETTTTGEALEKLNPNAGSTQKAFCVCESNSTNQPVVHLANILIGVLLLIVTIGEMLRL